MYLTLTLSISLTGPRNGLHINQEMYHAFNIRTVNQWALPWRGMPRGSPLEVAEGLAGTVELGR